MKPEENEICRKAFVFAQRNQKTIPQHNIKQEPEAVEVFKKLLRIVPTSIIEQVQNLKSPLHCIFIVGSDFDLIAGIASYVYYVHASGSFTHLSYSGYTDQEVVSDLFPPSPPNKYRLEYYLRGRTLFIGGLGNKHQSVFERLLGAFREINFSNPYKKDFGFLVVGVEDVALIPQELMNLSDVIGVESKKGASVNIPANTSQIRELFYDDSKGVLFLENGKSCELTRDEQVLVDYLRKNRRHITEIIDHFRTRKEYSNNNWGRNNFDNLKSDLNKKSTEFIGTGLIKNVEKGSGEYCISVKIKDKKFKK